MYVQRIPVSQIIYGIEMPAISGCPDLVENLVFEGSERFSPSLPVTAKSILRSKLANQPPEGVGECLCNSTEGDPLRPNPGRCYIQCHQYEEHEGEEQK